MSTAEQILVIILAAVLAIFLVEAIIAVAMLIKLIKTLRGIAERAQELVNSVETAAELFKGTMGKLTVIRFARSVIDLVTKHHKTKG